MPSSPDDVATRIYRTSSAGTYLGVAYKGYQPRSFAIDVPGQWSKTMKIRNLVTDQTQPVEIVDQKLHLELSTGAMELNAFLVK